MAARQQVELVIRARDLTRSVFRRIGRGLGNFRTQLLGAVGGTALLRQLFGGARDIQNAADALGVSAERLQAVQLLGAGQGANTRDIVDALLQLQQAAADARREGGEARNVFERLGFTTLPRDAVELFVALGEAVEASSQQVDELNADVSRLLGEEATRQFLGLFRRRGGTLRAEITTRAASADVRVAEEVAASAELSRQAQIELTTALNRFNSIIAPELPRLINALSDAVEIAKRIEAGDVLPAAGDVPGLAADVFRAGSPIVRVIDLVKRIADNTEDGGRLN